MGRLDGKIAVVTGAGSGNGRGMAVAFAQEGADVVIADVDPAGMEETARLVKQQERQALVQHCDVSKRDEVYRLIASAVEQFGRVDVAVANAGVAEQNTNCFEMTEAEWDRTVDINLKGVFFTLQAGANQMRAQGKGGRLIAIASIMAEWGSAATPAYCASKGGVKQLVKSFAQAGGPLGITCNGIGPGFIDTNMTVRLRELPQVRDMLIDRTPVGYIGDPADVANVAVFLASDESRFMNGTIVYPDGGILAGNFSNTLRLAQETLRGQATGQ
ncbi:MAG: glucose 1-dehydrogenase [Dehalococcoidia bacterium]|nr:glucose 1-dehydrogenase [Dehalococcoidia bacterium]